MAHQIDVNFDAALRRLILIYLSRFRRLSEEERFLKVNSKYPVNSFHVSFW